MTLPPGTRLGVYEITAQIGAGGMGEVYRATDTNLKRQVAMKVLPAAVAGDAERLARFQREAEVLAALNHPNIAAIYGLERAADFTGLVMELVEGEDLSQRISRGPISIDEALPIAKQIADALEAAHDQGIIHRDLKPANIKVRADGTVKVLDFGLAKAMVPAASSANAMNSPTLSIHATQAGIILGTAAYMSPEQAAGKPVDKRSDLWSFGVVVLEMLTGQSAFTGETVSHVLASVLKSDPDWTTLPARTPAALRRLLRRCLEKDRKRRLSAAADARLEIEEALTAAGDGAVDANPQALVPNPSRRWRHTLPWAVAAAVLGAASVLLWATWRTPAPAAVSRLSAEIGVDASLPTINTSAALALSADGTTLAFTAQKSGTSQLYIRRLDQLQSMPVGGTAGARDPFFSPDGQWVAFFSDGKLKKIPVTGGGTAVTLADAPADRGGTWTDGHAIVFQGGSIGALVRVPDSGGKPEPLMAQADAEFTQRWPQMLPGEKAVLYSAHTKGTGFDDANIVVRALPNGPPKIIQRGGYYGRYLASGHLVFIHANTLFAAPLDLGRLELTGPPVAVLEGVAANPNAVTPGAAAFAVSQTGTAVYLANQDARVALPIEWLDRAGNVTSLRAIPSMWGWPRVAPDGRQILVHIAEGAQQDVWVYEWARDTLTRLTSAGGGHQPVWTPDSRRVAFRSDRDGSSRFNLYWQRADGSGAAQRLTESQNAQFLGSWHPSGKFLAFSEISPQTGYDVMVLPMDGDEASGWKPGRPTAFLSTPATEFAPSFSPDGRWIAYESNESGRSEVYVRPFPGPGGKWQVSVEGARGPVWSRARHELLFVAPDSRLRVVSYAVEADSFRADKPRVWSDKRIDALRGFDLHPDGERVAAAVAAEGQGDAKQDKVVFIFNFFDELRRRAPPAK